MFLEHDEVMHFKFSESMSNVYYGESPLSRIIVAADIHEASSLNELSKWRNGARPDFLVSLKEDATAAQVEQIRGQINRDHRGVQQSGRFFVSNAATVTPLAFTPKEMEWLAGRKEIQSEIAAAFRCSAIHDSTEMSQTTRHWKRQRFSGSETPSVQD